MTEKQKSMVLELYFYLKYISNKDDIWQVETLPEGLLEERNWTFRNIEQIHNSCSKMQKCIVGGSIKEFLIICWPKTKKIKFAKTFTSSWSYWKKIQEWEFLGVTFVCKWFKILLHNEFSENVTSKICKLMKGRKVIWWYHQIFWSLSWTSCYNDYYLYEPPMIE